MNMTLCLNALAAARGGERRVLATAAAALVAAAAGCTPAQANVLSDAYPSPQAVAARAEFLAQAPEPAGGAASVCVIDTGVTPLPDMGSQITHRFAIDGGSPDDIEHDPSDPRSGHGSFVAGVIASQVDGQGAAGIWPRAKIVSVRVFNERGQARPRRTTARPSFDAKSHTSV